MKKYLIKREIEGIKNTLGKAIPNWRGSESV